MRQEDYEKEEPKPPVLDQTLLISELSHQLEEARALAEGYQEQTRQVRVSLVRAEGARDALKELLVELMK